MIGIICRMGSQLRKRLFVHAAGKQASFGITARIQKESETSAVLSLRSAVFTTVLALSALFANAQTTVTYPQRVANYYTSFTAGTAGTFDQGSFQMGQYANAGAKQVASFRKFRTDGSGSSTGDRAMQVGDVFVVRLSATRAFGRIGFSLLASPSATTAWTDRENNYAMSMNLDGNGGAWGNWYAKYNGGGTSAGSANVAGQQTTYKDFTFTLTLTAPDRMNATWTDGTTTSNLYDIQLNTSNPITDYCVYLEDDWDGGANRNVYWGLGAAGTQHSLTNNGVLSHGQSNGSYTVSGVMTNGLDANSASVNSLNNALTKVGSGTLTLSGANTYNGTTTVSAGTLQLGAADRISNSSNMVLSGGTFSTGSGAGFNETIGTLSVTANSTIALGTGAHTLTFANSSATTFTSGTILTITGWTGTNNGNSSGTAGKIFFGSSAGTLTGLQLSRIRFNISAVNYGAMQLSTGEIVPSGGQVLYYGGATGTWTGSIWGTVEGGPYTTAWTSGRHAIMNLTNGANTLTGATTNIAAITVNAAVTYAAGGTIGFGPAGAAVAPIYVDNGVTFQMLGQGISTTAGNGMIKLGAGTLQGANGNAFTGGFTINNGMFAAGGAVSMGDGGILTINSGTIAGTATRDFSNRLDLGITIGGDFTLGSSTSPAVGTSNLTFNNNTALGSSVTRTITLGGTGLYSWNGIISGTSSNLTVGATAAGTLALGGVNTYGGNTTINGGTVRPTVTGALPTTTGLVFANTSGASLDLSTTAITQTVVSVSGGGSTGGNISFGAPATAEILTINQSANTTYSGLISGNGAIVKTGAGILTLGHTANTYTGTTTITAGELRLNPSTTTGSFASQVILNGGKLSTTGITASTVFTSSSTLNLNANSTIDLGSNAHDLKFANSSGVSWAGSTLTINGWTGTGGSSGTAGRIFIGTTSGGLIAGQLSKITFNGYAGTPILLGTGELVPAVAGVTYTWNGSASGAWATPANWTPGTSVAGPTASDNVVIPTAGSYTNALAVSGTVSCYDFTVNGTGTYSMAASSNLTIGGTYTYSSSVAATFNCSSTLNISGTGANSIPAANYGTLNLSGGARTLASSGTIGICGAYTPGSSMTVTGSTVDFNGSGSQSIAASTYNNLTISNARGAGVITLPAGTIAVGGTFDVSTLSGFTASVNASSIFDFTSGSAQSIPAFFYGQLNNSGGGNRTWASSGTIDISVNFSPGSGTHTNTGSTVRYSATSGTIQMVTFTGSPTANRQYNNLIFNGAGATWKTPNATVLGVAGDLTVTAGTLLLGSAAGTGLVTVDGTSTVNGGTIELSSATSAGTLTFLGDFTMSSGLIQKTSAVASTVNFHKATGTQTISQSGGSITSAGAGTTWNIGNASTTNTVQLSSNLAFNATSLIVLNGATLDVNASTLSGTYATTVNNGGTIRFGSAGIISNTGNFTLSSGGNLITANTAGIVTTGATGTVRSSGTRSYNTAANYTYNPSSDGVTGSGLAGAATLTINTTSGANVTLSKPTLTFVPISVAVSLQSGVLVLDQADLQMGASATFTNGGSFSASNMVATINSIRYTGAGGYGRIQKLLPSGSPSGLSFFFPIGDITGTDEYTPVNITNLGYTGATGTPYISFRVYNAKSAYDASLNDYLTRTWSSASSSFPSATGVSMNATFTYVPADVVGTEANIRLYNYAIATGSWTNKAVSGVSNVYTITGLTDADIVDNDFAGRPDVPAPLYFRSASAGPNIYESASSWLVSTDPAFVSPAGVTPSTYPLFGNSDSIRVMSGHTINVTTAGSVAVDNMRVDPGATLGINSGAILIVANGTGTDLLVGGTLINQSAGGLALAGTVQFNGVALYDHNVNSGTIPAATWLTGSECRVTGSTTTAPSGLNQSFSDFTWACPSMSSLSLSGALTTVGRDFNVSNTNGANLSLVSSTGSLAMTVGRDFNISGGNVIGAAGTVSPTIAVSGNLNVTGTGFFTLANSASTTGTAGMTVSGTGTISSTANPALVVGGSPSKVATLTVSGLVTKSSTGTVSIGTGTAVSTLVANGGLTVSGGTLNVSNGGNGGVLTVAASTTFTISGGAVYGSATAHTSTINANGNVVLSGTGGLTFSNNVSGSSTFNLADNQTFTIGGSSTAVVGQLGTGTLNIGTNTTSTTTTALTVNGGTLLVASGGTGTINIYGDLNLTSGLVNQSGGTATVNFVARGSAFPATPHNQTVTQSSATVSGTIAFNVGATGSNTLLTLGSNVNFGTGSTITVTGFTSTNFSYLDFGTYTLDGLNFTQQNYGVMTTAHADGFWTIATGLTTGALRTTATRTLNANGNFSYNGTGTQVTGDAVTQAYNFSSFNSLGTLTLSNNLTINSGGSLYLSFFGLHGKLYLSTFNCTIASGASITGASSTDFVVTNSTGQLKQTVGASTVIYPVGNSAFNPMTLNNTGGTSDVYGVNVVDAVTSPAPFDATKLINRYWVVTEAVGGGSSLAVSGQYNGGEENVNFAAGSTLRMGLYTSLWSQNGATSAGGGPFIVSSSTDFTSIGTFGIGKDDGFLTAVTTYTWNGSASSSWATPANWTPATSVAGPTSTDHIVINVPGTNTLDINSSRSITDFDLSGTGTFIMSGSSDLTINGNFTYTSSASPTFSCGSTFNIFNSGSQPIPAFNYGNLNGTGGDRVLASSGTIGICGSFTRGAGTYTITGSTVNFNGSGAQTISAGTYNNLTISNARGGAALTLGAGTIDVASTFDPSPASAYTVTVGTNIFNFSSAGAQSIPAFYYYSITNSGNGNRTWASSGVIDVNSTFTPGSGTHTITGSSFRYSNVAAGSTTLSSFTTNVASRQYNNLEFVGGASTAWVLGSGFNLGVDGNFVLSGAGTFTVATNATANTMVVDGNLTINGAGNLIIANTATATLVNSLTVSGNTTISSGNLIGVGSSSSTTVQGNFTTNDLTISGTGAMNLDAASNTANSAVTVNGNMSVTSSTANAVNFGSGTNNAANVINLKGNLTKSGSGTFGCSGIFNATSGFFFNNGSGTQTLDYSGTAMTSSNFTVAAGSTLQLLSNLTLGSNATASSVTAIGILDCQGFVIAIGNSANAFTLQSTGTLQTSHTSGVSSAISGFTNVNTSWAAGATFVFTGTAQNTGMSGYTNISSASLYTVTWLGNTSLTLDKTLSLNVFNFTNSGLVNMGNFSLSLPSSAGALTGSGFGVSKMFVTNGTGILSRAVLAAGTGLPFTWPIGESTGTTEYSPVTVTSIATPGIGGTIGFRVVDGVHSDLSLATSYLSRYWPCTVTGFNATYTLSTLTFTYDSGTDVVVGPEASLKGNSYNATTMDWTQYASSSAGSNLLTITSGISGTNMPTNGTGATYDITARIDVPVYYRTVSGGSWSTPGIWEISSSASFGSTFTPVNPPNTTNSDSVLIRNGHTVNVNSAVSIDEVFIKSGGTLNVTTGGTFTLVNGPGAVDMRDDGSMLVATPTTISASAKLFVTNLLKQTVTGQITATGTVEIGGTGTYEHGTASGASVVPTFTWANGSTCLLKYAGTTLPTGLGQAFHHVTLDADPGSTGAAGNLNNIAGNLTLLSTGGNNLVLGANTNYTVNVGGNVDVQGTSGLDVQSGSGTSVINITGDLLQAAGTLITRSGSGTFTWNVNGNFTQSGGTYQMNTVSSTGTFNLKGNLTNNGSISAASGTNRNFNFIKASGTQTISQTGGTMANAFLWNVGDGTTTTNTVQFLSNVNMGASGSPLAFTVKSGATVDFGTFVLSASNAGSAFVMQDNTSLITANTAGITSSGATGSVQTGTRTYTGASNNNNFTYNSSVAGQVVGNGLPTTMNRLYISNTSGGTNTVDLPNSNYTIKIGLNLTAGLINQPLGNIIITSTTGSVNGTGGNFATTSLAYVTFQGTNTVTGTVGFRNCEANGGVNFGTGSTINNNFRINGGGFVTSNAPTYATGSTLVYNSGGNYGRGLEWSAASGKGYPYHVTIQNNTTLQPGANSNTGTVLNMAGDLIINTGSAMYLDWGGMVMTVNFNVLGSVTLTGNLSLSTTSGDLFVGKDWTRTGTFSPQNREVVFNGSVPQYLTGVTTFDYFRMNNTSTNGLNLNNSIIINNRLFLTDGKIIIGNNDITLNSGAQNIQNAVLGDSSSFIVTNGTGVVTQNVPNTAVDRWYPVGPTTSRYAPATLNQQPTGVSDDISVRAKSAPAFDQAVNDDNQMVGAQWIINEASAGGNDLRTVFGWKQANEGSSFSRSSSIFHGNWIGTTWDVRATNPVVGTDPYFTACQVLKRYTGNLSTQLFAVGNINGFLPCIQSASAGDWNTPGNWVPAVVPPTDALACVNHAMTITTGGTPSPNGVTFNSGGSVAISNGFTLGITTGGFITNSSGATLNNTTGTIAFAGTATVNGAHPIGFNKLQISGGATFTTVPTINTNLEILSGGFVSAAPNYGSSSTLIYNTGGPYGRSTEWNATSGAGFPANVQITGGTTLDISNGSNTSRAISGNFTVDNGASATMSSMTGNLTIPGNFTLNGAFTQSSASGGDIILGGNWSSGATATFTHNNRDVKFNGTSGTQTIANTASGLEFGYLTIDNTGTGVDLLNTITANTFRVNASRTFNLTSDKIIIAPGGDVLINGTFNANTGTVEYTDGGTFTNNGTFNRGTSTIDFLGTSPGSVVGTVQTNFHNIRLAPSSGIDFGGGALRGKLSGTFQLRAGSFVTGNAPIYEPGSKLMYSGGGTFNRNIEWDPSTVQKVEVRNNTTLYCGFNGTSFTHTLADSLIIQSGSTYDMTSAGGANMTAPTQVGGNLWLKGTLLLSGSVGGDLEVAGDFQNDGGTFTCNSRLTTFNGSTNGSIKGSSNTNFCLLTVNKTSGNTLTASVPFTASLAGGSIVRVQGGTFDLNGQAITLGGGTNTLRVDAGFANGQTLKTGGTTISSFNTYTDNGITTATLGGKIDYSGTGSESLLNTLVATYNQLWITGGSTKSITQSATANGNVNIDPSTTLDFGATASILNAKADLVNQGSTIGSGTGKIELNGTAIQNMSGSGTYRNLDVNNTSNVNSSGKPTISGKLNVVAGKVFTASDTIILGSSATITETLGAGEYFVRGNLKTTRTVGTSAETFGGMGVDLTAGANLGTVTVNRQSGVVITGSAPCCTGFNSIGRNWTITPTVQPSVADRTLTLTWYSDDDNAMDMTNLQLWKRSTVSDPWVSVDVPQDVSSSNPRSATWTGVSSFSQFTGADLNNPLPLSLLKFSGRNNNGTGLLNWSMADQKDLKGFRVEKSIDGKNFSDIGFVAPSVDKAAETNYAFTDRNLSKDSYYRIRIAHQDGTSTVSQVVIIRIEMLGNADVQLYPNPSASGAQISIDGNLSGMDVDVRIIGTDGRENGTLSGELESVNAQFSEVVKSLPAGVYQIKVVTDEASKTVRLIKQ